MVGLLKIRYINLHVQSLMNTIELYIYVHIYAYIYIYIYIYVTRVLIERHNYATH